ncbi:H-type lectin domain-containing protein [Epibacterium sp. MM17-32]|uniref:H-type lectin domain-containing protein n=1 Tax=Epibacterium sp. MM17-32 TaxID=2917734 RepID=UPI001EF4F3E5|nr:H-type lectin domain-containing protein [Epibacterium sp. MM17-32]MCG7627673.1 H-type lectin domain-containing protein [Epibacterium sp. MM17-32]
MRTTRLRNPRTSIVQGDVEVFSEFDSGGTMWTGEGERERRLHLRFDEAFAAPPAIHLTASLMDMDHAAAYRAELIAEEITAEGFDVVFRTWSDSRVARVRAAWMAIGDMPFEDDWDVE